MRAKLLHEEAGQKTFALVFDEGDEFVSGPTTFAKENDLDAASIIKRSTGRSRYRSRSRCSRSWETWEEPRLHAHAVVGGRDGTTRGGHLLEAHVRPTLEVILVEPPEHLRKTTDEKTGLALISIGLRRERIGRPPDRRTGEGRTCE